MHMKKCPKAKLTLSISSLVICLCLTFSTALASEKTVSVATLYGYPPYCFLKGTAEEVLRETISESSDSSVFQGYTWDVIRESFQQMGYTIKLNVMSWPEAMEKVKDGTIELLFPTGKNAEREKVFLYSREPVNEAKFLIYVRKNSNVKWEGLKSLNGLTIGVMKGFNYGDSWKAQKSIQKVVVNNIIEGLKMLDNKELDGFAGYEVTWDYTLKQQGWKAKFKKLPVFDSSAEYLIGLKTNKRISTLLNDYDTGKRLLIKNGKFDRITRKWQ